jgi:hypothetical protein
MAATTITLDVMHTSMQFSDSTAHKQADANRIFSRAVGRKIAWVTGTEAGEKRSTDLRAFLAKEAKASGYKFVVHSDCWVAVRQDIIVPRSFNDGFVQTEPGRAKVHSALGITWAEFDNTQLGTISIGVSHYMTHGQKPGDEYYGVNTKLTKAIGEWGKAHGAGRKLCFFQADSNIPDRTDDVFRGAPFTTLADELKDWQNTGHGSIDIIASYDADTRVKGKYFRVLDDKEFPLNTDHFACEGGFEVRGKAA